MSSDTHMHMTLLSSFCPHYERITTHYASNQPQNMSIQSSSTSTMLHCMLLLIYSSFNSDFGSCGEFNLVI